MKSSPIVLPLVAVLLLAGCSGFAPGVSKGRVVSPQYLARYSGIGSLSTLWYRGSDERYHYFAHYVKVSTPYRIPREELQVPGEFPYGSQDPVFVGDAPYWKGL